MKHIIYCILLVLLTAAGMPLFAQKANYAAAEKYNAPNLSSKTGTLKVIPFFLKKSDAFWFLQEDSSGRHHYIVDPAKPVKRLLYDRGAIATQLRAIRKEPIDTAAITYSFNFSSDEKSAGVSYKGRKYDYYFYEKRLTVSPGENHAATRLAWPSGSVSPNRRWQLYARAHNLYLGRIGEEGSIALSADAGQYYSFNTNEDDTSVSRNTPTDAAWLPDSKRFYVVRKDRRKVGTMSVMYSMPFGRPRVDTYKYELPGDKDVTQYELFIGDTSGRRLQKISTGKWPDQELAVVCADGRSDEIFFTRKKRTRDEIELCAVNTITGQVRVVIHETSRPVINEDLFSVSVLNGGSDIVWWSDRSGWGQYYLYGNDGQLKASITQGAWTAGRILAIDTAHRRLYFYGYGRESGRNPYFAHAYSAALDGGEPRLLTPEDATHEVFMSKRGYYIIDTWSRIDQSPETVLRNKEGRLLCGLAKADVTRLYRMGWKPAEPFTVKARDGVTDL
ncbi:MAG: DPP IV N-terminal domain-containing protein, partial [Bacteroidetes bacterium]|nr:DPP IV N-terminal domain-containing protein [Bacteroidota bacterium]